MKIDREMLEAAGLTRAGRLAEATAVIQRALRGLLGLNRPAEPETPPIEGTYRIVTEEAVAPAPATAAPARAPEVESPGRFIAGAFTNHAGSREYKLYVPRGRRGRAFPLVVMLHGCMQTPDDFATGTRMNGYAEQEGWCVVYPAQTGSANVSRCWNWFKTADQQRDQGEPAIIADLTRAVVHAYDLDASRVYVAGLSAGGAMAAVMGSTYPDLYAAVGIHSGIAYAVAHDLPSAFSAMRGGAAAPAIDSATALVPVPTIVFHGDQDTTVHPRNADHVVAQSATVSATRGPSVKIETGAVPDGHGYTRAIHQDPRGQVFLEQWVVHGAGHAWSGGSAEGSFTDPRGPDATREMLRFFAGFRNPRAQ